MIYDISQPVFTCEVYPGDEKPVRNTPVSMEQGAVYNLTTFSMCAHNGTHTDAPRHFIKDGKGIGELPLTKFVGMAYVAPFEGALTAQDAQHILQKAENACPAAKQRILIKGNAVVTEEAARVFADAGIDLIGNESQSVGPVNAPMAVHRILLGREIVLLEGIRLAHVREGAYVLNCAPLDLSDADGAPCRAILYDPSEF